MKRIGLALTVAFVAASAFAQGSEDEARSRLVEAAFKYEGVPYVYGAESPRAFDCSGFVRYVYREALGMELPRSARSFWSSGSPIDWRKARAGDVLVYDTVGGAPSHVALVVGDGTVIHAVSAGLKTGVIVSPMNDKYWAPRLLGARAFIASSSSSVPMSSVPMSSVPERIEDDAVIADIGVEIPSKRASIADRIPTAAGTSVAFTVTNGTGRSGGFTVLFFVTDPKTYRLRQIHDERVKLDAGAALSLPPYRFDAPGKYKLVVKDSWGNPLVEREFMVSEREDR
jgi:hypothetical protein